MRDDVRSLGRIVPVCACCDKFLCSGNWPLCDGAILSASGRVTVGPVYGCTLDRIYESFGRM